MEEKLPEIILNTSQLAEVFCTSERQIQRLVEARVIEAMHDYKKPYEFDLKTVVPQYANFLLCKAAGIATIKTYSAREED